MTGATTGLTIVLTEPDPARLRHALTLLAAAAALGQRARLYLHEGAVALAEGAPADPARDAGYAAHGLPDLATLWATALAMPVRVVACQTGLTLAGVTADTLDPRVEVAGPVGLLAGLGDDRLVVL